MNRTATPAQDKLTPTQARVFDHLATRHYNPRRFLVQPVSDAQLAAAVAVLVERDLIDADGHGLTTAGKAHANR